MRQWVIPNVAVEVELLRIAKHRVGYCRWLRSPIGHHPAAHRACVVPSPEVIEVAFGIAFFAGEFVVLVAGSVVGALFAEGVEIRVITWSSLPGLDHFARSAEVVLHALPYNIRTIRFYVK